MITVILCLRPLRIPKFIWFKILYDRRYEFGPEMCANEDPNIVMHEAYAVRNFGLMKLFIDKVPRPYYWTKLLCINNDAEAVVKCNELNGRGFAIFDKACRYGRLEVVKALEKNFMNSVIVIGFRRAMKSYHLDIVKYILENFEIDVEDFIYNYGCRKGLLDILVLLLPYGKKKYSKYLECANCYNTAVVNYLKKLI